MREMSSHLTFPRAIVHFDGDSFFASVEQAMDYRLRGKPVITGGERGIVTSLSKEAKARGLARGMPMRQIREICPEVIAVVSNYTAYSIYARRMYAIVRRFTPLVHEYSIDECFADITDLDERFHMSYEDLARTIKRELEERLGITFGVGLAPNKLLAKVASKHRKPAGFTSIPIDSIELFLKDLPIGKVWGIGSSMSVTLGRLGIRTALELAQKDRDWIRDSGLSKPFRQMWYELQGHCIHDISGSHDDTIGSIMKSRTFSPPSRSRAVVFSQLSKNIEHACATARLHGVRARAITFYLKTQEFTYHSLELSLINATADPVTIITLVAAHFKEIYADGILYRATGIALREIVRNEDVPPDLFGDSARADASAPVLRSIDTMNKRYGKATVYLASSMHALAHRDRRDKQVRDRSNGPRLSIDHRKKSMDLPFLGSAR